MELIAKAKPPEANARNSTLMKQNAQALKTHFLEHKPSSSSSEVSYHIHFESPGLHIDLDEVKILDRLNLAGLKEESRGNLHKGEQSYSQRGRGPVQTSRSLRVYSQVKCSKGHDLRQAHSRW